MMDNPQPWGLQWRSSKTFIIGVIVFAVFSDVVLYGALVPVFPFSLSERTGIPEDRIQTCVSQLLAACAFGSLFTNPTVGYFSDRATSRKVHFLTGLLALILSTILLAFARIYWVMLVARVLQGCSSAVVWTVGMAVLAETLPTEQLGVAMGTVGSIVSLAMVSSPVLGGTIYHAFGYQAVFWVLGGLLVVDVILRLMMIERKDAERWGVVIDESPSEPDEDTALLTPAEPRSVSMLSLILSPRFLTASWMAFMSSTILTGPFDAVLPLHVKRIFSFTALTSGAIFAALALPEMILGPVAGWGVDRYGSKLIALIGFLAICPGLFLLVIPTGPATTSQILSLIAILGFNGCATSLVGAPAMTEITLLLRTDGSNLDGNGYAQGYGWFNVAYSSGMLFGPLIAGWIVETWSWTVLCFVMGTAAGATIIPIYLFTGEEVSCWGRTKVDTDGTE